MTLFTGPTYKLCGPYRLTPLNTCLTNRFLCSEHHTANLSASNQYAKCLIQILSANIFLSVDTAFTYANIVVSVDTAFT